MSQSSHRDLIVDQFTRQATPFSTAKTIASEEALKLLVDACGAGRDDRVLDVACGGGLVVCAFAQVVREAEGIDITPAMLERARALAAEKGLTNTRWRQGDVLPLPYSDASFTIVTSRFTFHHFQDPLGVLTEMKRVCAPGGRIAVVDTDASADPTKAAAFNQMEILRDPSHVRAMPGGGAHRPVPARGAARAAAVVVRAPRRAREPAAPLVPQSRRRRQDPRRVPRLGERRPSRHPDPSRGRSRSLRVPRGRPGRRPRLIRRHPCGWTSLPRPPARATRPGAWSNPS